MGQKISDTHQPLLWLGLEVDLGLWQGRWSMDVLGPCPRVEIRFVDLWKGMAGAMKALQSTGILDCCTYSVGLSGTGLMTHWKGVKTQNRILPIY